MSVEFSIIRSIKSCRSWYWTGLLLLYGCSLTPWVYRAAAPVACGDRATCIELYTRILDRACTILVEQSMPPLSYDPALSALRKVMGLPTSDTAGAREPPAGAIPAAVNRLFQRI